MKFDINAFAAKYHVEVENKTIYVDYDMMYRWYYQSTNFDKITNAALGEIIDAIDCEKELYKTSTPGNPMCLDIHSPTFEEDSKQPFSTVVLNTSIDEDLVVEVNVVTLLKATKYKDENEGSYKIDLKFQCQTAKVVGLYKFGLEWMLSAEAVKLLKHFAASCRDNTIGTESEAKEFRQSLINALK